MGILLLNLSLVVASWFQVTQDRSEGLGGAGGTGVAVERPLTFSRDGTNVLILVLDRFMGGFVERILDEEPDLAARLEGFVWYPRTLSAGDNSISGMHPILGGYDYTPLEMNARGGDLREISAESFSIMPRNFAAAGYRVNVVNPRGLGFTVEGDCDFLQVEGVECAHLSPIVVKRLAERLGVPMEALSSSDYADLLVLLGVMRASPYAFKAVLTERGPWRPFLDHSAGTTFRQWAELRSLHESTTTDSGGDTYNQVFNILPHEPYFLGEDCQPKQTRLDIPGGEVRARGFVSLFALQHAVAARCSLLLVADYRDWMKTAGVYHNSKIVIVSDHGIIGPVEDRSTRAVAGGTTDNLFVRSRSVLLVKDRDARGALRISEQFMPNAEVPRLVCEEIGGCVNPFLDERPIEALGRDDPFIVTTVPWQFNLQRRERLRHRAAVRGGRGRPLRSNGLA